MKKFCKNLKENLIKIIYHEKKKEMIPLTSEEVQSYPEQNICLYVFIMSRTRFRVNPHSIVA